MALLGEEAHPLQGEVPLQVGPVLGHGDLQSPARDRPERHSYQDGDQDMRYPEESQRSQLSEKRMMPNPTGAGDTRCWSTKLGIFLKLLFGLPFFSR